MPNTKKKRRLKDGRITFISLCRRGKNGIRTLLKGDGSFGMRLLTKSEGDLLHALVYVPEENGGVDADGDVMTAAEIRKMAHDFLGNGGGIDVEHDLERLTSDQVRIAETFIVQKGDDRFDGMTDYDGAAIDPTGSWGMILKILDPELLADVRSGAIDGVSMFGHARFETLGKSASSKHQDMDPEDIKAIAKAVATAVVEAQAAANPKDPEPSTPAEKSVKMPEFTGDATDPDALDAYETECLKASLDLSKPEDMKKWRAHLAKSAEKKSSNGGDGESETELEKAQREAKEANERVVKLEKSSNQPEGAGDGDEGDGKDEIYKSFRDRGLSRDKAKNAALGTRLGRLANKLR